MGAPWIAPDTPAEPRRSAPRIATTTTPTQPRRTGPLRGSPVDRLQPRSVGALLDGGFEVLRFRFPVVAAVTATLVLPLYGLPTLLSSLRLARGLDQYSIEQPGAVVGVSSTTTTSNFVEGVFTYLGSIVALGLLGVAMAHLVISWLTGSDPTYRDVMRVTLRRSWVVVLALIITLPLKAIGVFLCLVGAIFSIGPFIILSPVIAVEQLGPFAAVARSWRLSTRRLSVPCWMFITNVLAALVAMLLGWMTGAIVEEYAGDASWLWLAQGGIGLAVQMLMLPLVAAWAALTYVDLRARVEGFDLQLELDRRFTGEATRAH